MKQIRTISGILGILVVLLVAYVLLSSPSYVSSTYAIISIAAILIASILTFMRGRITSIIATVLFVVGAFSFLTYVGVVDSAQKVAGVNPLPNYIPDALEMGGFALPVLAAILSFVSIFSKE